MLQVNNYKSGVAPSQLLKKSIELITNPTDFNSEHYQKNPLGWVLAKKQYVQSFSKQYNINTFRKLDISKDDVTGTVRSESNVLSVVSGANCDFITLRKIDVFRDKTCKVSKHEEMLRLRLNKNKQENLPHLVAMLLERNLLSK